MVSYFPFANERCSKSLLMFPACDKNNDSDFGLLLNKFQSSEFRTVSSLSASGLDSNVLQPVPESFCG